METNNELNCKENKETVKMTFEQAIDELEQIVAKLEGGKFPLEESVKMFQRGVELSRYCNSMLDKTEQKITKLIDGDKLEENTFQSE